MPFVFVVDCVVNDGSDRFARRKALTVLHRAAASVFCGAALPVCVSFLPFLLARQGDRKFQMNSDPEEEAELPYEIGQAASVGDFDRVKAWLAGGSASAPRSINSCGEDDWTLLHWTAARARSPEYIEFARYLISQGARVDAKTRHGWTTLHLACGFTGDATPAVVSMLSLLVATGATVNMEATYGQTALFEIKRVSESTIDIVTILLRAGASLDFTHRQGWTRSFEEHLDHHIYNPSSAHVGAIRTLVTSVRAAGSWKAHCRLAHKEVLRLRSLVARGRVKLPRARRRSPRDRGVRQERALAFVARQGDNGIVWNILSFWRATY